MKFIEHLLPHHAPFLMVESIVEYAGGSIPTLNAEYSPRPSEPVFSGAEPPLYWPSAYVIEGLSQCCSLLNLIWACKRICATNALSEENVSTALMNVEGAGGAYTLEQLLEIFESSATNVATRIGMLASVDIEIVGQVQYGRSSSVWWECQAGQCCCVDRAARCGWRIGWYSNLGSKNRVRGV